MNVGEHQRHHTFEEIAGLGARCPMVQGMEAYVCRHCCCANVGVAGGRAGAVVPETHEILHVFAGGHIAYHAARK